MPVTNLPATPNWLCYHHANWVTMFASLFSQFCFGADFVIVYVNLRHLCQLFPIHGELLQVTAKHATAHISLVIEGMT